MHTNNTIATNRKARFDYTVLETYEAGIVLSGLEVKALRKSHVSLNEAWVNIRGNEAFIVGMSITTTAPEWQNYNPTQERKLLLRKLQIKKLNYQLSIGLSIIPLKIYFNEKNMAKIEIALVKGKKKYDKREAIKKRDNQRYGY